MEDNALAPYETARCRENDHFHDRSEGYSNGLFLALKSVSKVVLKSTSD